MTDADGTPHSVSPELLDQLASEFEQNWRNGDQPQIEEFLQRVEEKSRPSLFRELLKVELELRQAEGSDPALKECQDRFPAYAGVLQEIFGSWSPDAPVEPTVLNAQDGKERGSDSLVGQTLNGRYRLDEELGRGGMAVVYRAHQLENHQPVAIKMMNAKLTGTPSRSQRSLVIRTLACPFGIDPVFFDIGHSLASRDATPRTGLVERARFRPVTKRLEPIPSDIGIPVIDDDLNRHPAAPQARLAFVLIRARRQSPVTAFPVGFQFRRHSQPRRGLRC